MLVQGKFKFKSIMSIAKKILISYYGVASSPIQLVLITNNEIQSLPPKDIVFLPEGSSDYGRFSSPGITGVNNKKAIAVFDWFADTLQTQAKRSAVLINIDGVEISGNPAQYIQEDSISAPDRNNSVIDRLNNNKAVVVYDRLQAGVRERYARVLTISEPGEELIVNSEYSIGSGVYGKPLVIGLSPEIAIFMYQTVDPLDNLSKIYAQLLSITGTSISSQPPIVVDSAQVLSYGTSVFFASKLSSSKLFVGYGKKEPSDISIRRYGRVLSVSGSDILVSDPETELTAEGEILSSVLSTSSATIPGNQTSVVIGYTVQSAVNSEVGIIKTQLIKIDGSSINPQTALSIGSFDLFSGFSNYRLTDLSENQFIGLYYFKESDFYSPYRPFFVTYGLTDDTISPSEKIPASMNLEFYSRFGMASIPLRSYPE